MHELGFEQGSLKSNRLQMMLLLLLLISFTLFHLMASNERVKNLIIEPIIEEDSNEKVQLLMTRDLKTLPRSIKVAFDAYDKHFQLELRKNDRLLHPELQISFLDGADGQSLDLEMEGYPYTATSLLVNNVPVQDDTIQLARFGVSGDIKVIGGFEWQGALFRLRPSNHPFVNEKSTDSLFVTREWMDERRLMNSFGVGLSVARNETVTYKCGHDSLSFNRNPVSNFIERAAEHTQELKVKQPLMALFAKRADKDNAAAANSGCSGTRKALYLGIAADSLYLRKFDSNRQRALQNIMADFNLVSAIYERAFNVELGILSIVLLGGDGSGSNGVPWDLPCTPDNDIGKRLNEFSRWRSTQSKQIGLFHLVSGCSESEVVGIAWINQVCQVKSFKNPGSQDTVSGTSVSVLIPNQFSVIAHEIGHNFGAVHDCDSAECRSCKGNNCDCCTCGPCDCRGQFVMHPESGGLSLKEFSPCSRGDICSKIPVLEPGKYKTIKTAVCGNGIVEEGEECDCGSPEECAKDPCCQSGCKLREGAECADGNHSCCKGCKVRKDQFMCARATPGGCQFDSKCDGVSADCPAITNAPDGSTCPGLENGKCASGLCTTRDAQCRAIGKRLGIRRACPSTPSTCKLTCESQKGKCVLLDAAFLDGTPCGSKGTCTAGVCSESSVSSFVVENGPVVVVAGALVGALLFILMLKSILTLRRQR